MSGLLGPVCLTARFLITWLLQIKEVAVARQEQGLLASKLLLAALHGLIAKICRVPHADIAQVGQWLENGGSMDRVYTAAFPPQALLALAGVPGTPVVSAPARVYVGV